MSCDFPSDEELVAAAVRHEQQSKQAPIWQNTSGFPVLHDGQPVAWVKYGREPDRLLDEADTQEYVYQTLRQLPGVSARIRVPQIYRVIEDDDIPYVLTVMEYVHGRTIRQWLEGESSEEWKHLLWDRVLYALSSFLAFQPPEPIPPPGPAGGGRISHLVFGEYTEPGDALRDYDSVQDLQDHVNQTIDGRANRADFAKEDFRLCYCDPHQSNFILADGEGGGPIYVIDFEHCMWLPISFLRWSLVHNQRDAIFPYLRRNLERLHQLPRSETNHRALNMFNALQGRR